MLISLSNLKDIEGEAALAQSAGLARARSRAVAWAMSRVPKDLLKKDLPRKIAFRGRLNHGRPLEDVVYPTKKKLPRVPYQKLSESLTDSI